jgi:hypothetical protein
VSEFQLSRYLTPSLATTYNASESSPFFLSQYADETRALMDIEVDSLPVQQSYLLWYVTSLGMPTLLLIAAATLLAAGLVVLLFLRGRGPAVPAAMVFVLPLPLLIGLVCFLGGSILFLHNVALSGPAEQGVGWLSYAMLAMMHASSCFCPLLLLTLTLLMTLGFSASRKSGSPSKMPPKELL